MTLYWENPTDLLMIVLFFLQRQHWEPGAAMWNRTAEAWQATYYMETKQFDKETPKDDNCLHHEDLQCLYLYSQTT